MRVLTYDPAWCAVDGELMRPPSVATFADLVTRAASKFTAGAGTVLLTADAVAQLCSPLVLPPGSEVSGPGGPPGVADWCKIKMSGRPTVVVGTLPRMLAGECPLIVASPLDTCGGLAAWHRVTGQPWYLSRAITGMQILRESWGKRQPTAKVWASPGSPHELDYLPEQWQAPTRTPGREIQVDKTRAYIAAAMVVRLGRGALRPGPKVFDRTLAGYWLVELGPWNEPRLPNPAGYAGVSNKDLTQPRWVTSPTLDLLDTLSETGRPTVGYTIVESRVTQATTLLRSWAEKMRDAYDSCADISNPQDQSSTRVAVKAVGHATLGALAWPKNWLYRPDWWDAIIAQHRCNMFRVMLDAAHGANIWPIECKVDAIWYPYQMECKDPAARFRMGDKLGQWKIKGERQWRGDGS